ncbi:MAG: 50S ribosomal protein L15 [Patescibacteria group bacterium]|nr:50S ribosomal protein L15 [Patescibacteria group bacterium]
MQLHNLKRRTPLKKARRVARGGKRGKTAGRGTKGQKSRAGHHIRPEARDRIKKLPKQRGYRFNSFQVKPAVLNLEDLERAFKAGEQVSPQNLLERGLVTKRGGRLPAVKLLGNGALKKSLKVAGCQYSTTAKEKIEAAGGSLE